MGIFLISLFLLGFLIVPLFALAVCRSAGMADRRLQEMRDPVRQQIEARIALEQPECLDQSREKTRPIFQRLPVSIE